MKNPDAFKKNALLLILIIILSPIYTYSQTSKTYFAKDAVLSTGSVLETKNSGFTDASGYINFANEVGSYAEWKVVMAETDSQTIYIRFANGTVLDKSINITVNDSAVVDTFDFAGTGSYTSWQTDSVRLFLVKGLNRIRFISNTAAGAPNIDKIDVTGTPGTPQYDLTVNFARGNVIVDPPGGTYDENTEVKLTALPDTGYRFVNWSGDLSGNQNPAVVKMDADKNVAAVFYLDFDTTISHFEDSPIGFASVDAYGQNGTIGGAGGDTVYVNDLTILTADLATRVKANKKPVVYVIRDTVKGTGQISCKNVSNITFIGDGNGAKFDGVGIAITNAVNIIVRNIEFGNCQPDCITVNTTSSNSTHHIWIDHCTFSDSPEIDPGGTDHGGTHDGLLDITHRTNYVTVSWCHFYNHNKTSLVGYSDNSTDEQGLLKTTFHHNWWDNTTQRHPRVRWAECHVYNNYYDGTKGGTGMGTTGYGVASTDTARVLVEANYFRDVVAPTHIGEGSSPAGYLEARDNITENSGPILTNGTAFDPSFYYSYKPDDAAKIPVLVTKYAGSGKFNFIVTGIKSRKILPAEFTLFQNYPNPFNPSTRIKFYIPSNSKVRIYVYNSLGERIKDLLDKNLSKGTYYINWDGKNNNKAAASSGVYFIQMEADNFVKTVKAVLIR